MSGREPVPGASDGARPTLVQNRRATWRLFVAALLEPAANQELQRWVALARPLAAEHQAKLRWVPQPQRHLTLQFLGECEPSAVAVLEERILRALRSCVALRYSWTTVETFGAPQRARVLFAGLESDGSGLRGLAASIREQLQGLVDDPDKPFHQHVTLARLQPSRRTAGFLHAWRQQLSPPRSSPQSSPATYRFERVALIRSRLTPGGAEYRTVAEWDLDR